ncbi:hypothetical protein SORBI_3002G361001 [Sorghum bicolor]|uniref:Uncharacterized protein n=1 Tax=Sorghum bicolor TaxID=4558 RepID=A0A1W0W788_SORBI|nr:hypothetical protein SORBI_3002G361001 [Sorghum bicolor]
MAARCRCSSTPRGAPRLRLPRHPRVPRRGLPGDAAAPAGGPLRARAGAVLGGVRRPGAPLREAAVAEARRRGGGGGAGARGARGDAGRAPDAGRRARRPGVLRRGGVRVRRRRGRAVRLVVPHVRAPWTVRRGRGVPGARGVGGAVRAAGQRGG